MIPQLLAAANAVHLQRNSVTGHPLCGQAHFGCAIPEALFCRRYTTYDVSVVLSGLFVLDCCHVLKLNHCDGRPWCGQHPESKNVYSFVTVPHETR